MNPQPDDAMPGCVYYMTLVREEDDTQVHLAQCVYLAKDPRLMTLIKKSSAAPGDTSATPAPLVRPVYKDVNKKKRTAMDIFQIERLWKNEE